jgi:hypothetical protein
MKKIQIETNPFKGIRIPYWPVQEMCGYEPKTTFWQDYWIAIYFGKEAVQDTYDRAFNEWKTSVEYITEMVMVLTHIGDFIYERDKEMALLFYALGEKCYDWCRENLKGEELDYFYRVLD